MKLRQGFVSNSSSSSFLIYGAVVTSSLEEALENKHGEDAEIYEIMEDAGLAYYAETDYGSVVGLGIKELGEDETPRQFKARIKAQLEEVFGASVDTIKMYDGEYAC